MFDRYVPEMDASMVVGALRDGAWDEIVTQSRQLSLVAQWAAVHPGAELPSAGTGRLSVVGERAVRYGGPGTPKVAEFAAAELAPEVRLSVYQAHSLIADAVDLKFRFPLIWERIRRCQVRAYVARQIARRTRELPFDVAQRIDRLLVDKVTNLPPQRIEHLVDAALVKADPEGVRKAVEQAKRARMAHFSPSTPYGIRSLYARLDAPDATRLKATISRLTDILMHSPEPIPGVRYGDAQTRSEWEAIALATLGNPGLAFRILVEHDQPDLFTRTSELFDTDPDAPVNDSQAPFDYDVDGEMPVDDLPPDPETLPPDDLDDLGGVPESTELDLGSIADDAHRPEADADDGVVREHVSEAARQAALEALVRAIDPTKLFAAATLYVHLTDAALASAVSADCGDVDLGETPIARVEGVGPVLLSQVQEWLGSASRIRVAPVIDPGAIPPVDAYEFPDRMREALWLRTPASVFPYSTNLSRGMDINHTDPYRTGGSGQTGLHNAGPLGRAEHRFVTHGRISVRQPGPGVYVYKTMYGRVLITNPTGTFDLGDREWAAAVWQLADQQSAAVAA
jgi:hypothetical protein